MLLHSSLADGVQNAAIVCCFISSDYEQSENCQLELQYAHKRGKRVILFMLCSAQSWEPSSWLASSIKEFECIRYEEDCYSDIDFSADWLMYQIEHKPDGTQLPQTPLAEQPSYLYELVKHDYRRNSRIKRFMNPAKSISIEESYINLAIVEKKEHDEKEKRLRDSANNNVVMDTYEEIYGTKTRIDIKDIFETRKNDEKKVLVFGRAGIGKSTFCRYGAHQWASGKIWPEYDLVALISLRSLTEQQYPSNREYDLVDVLRKTCFCWNRRLSEKDEKLLQQLFDKSLILWLLDGYDEIVQSIPQHLKHLLNQLLKTPHHIVTSRPYLNILSYKVRMEIIGFTDENIPKYIGQFLDQVETKPSGSRFEERELLDYLKLNSRIWGIAHIPINLELICSVWSNTNWSESEPMTMTILYGKLSLSICRRYLKKQKQKSPNEINLMDEQEVYNDCKNEMAFLETLAFLGMKQNAIVLRPDLLKKARDESKCSFTKNPHLLNIGLLKSLPCGGTGTENETEKDHCFVHLSFQEFYAARYLVNTLHHGPREKAIKFIQHQKYNRRCTLLLRFASGLAVETECNETIKLFWDTILEAPPDLIGIRHIQLVMNCFDEVVHNPDFPYRSLFLNWVQYWIKHMLQSANLVLQDYMATTLKSCISIMNDSIIQTTLIHVLENHARLKQHILLNYGHRLLETDPRSAFSCHSIDQSRIRISETRTHGTAPLSSFDETAARSAEIGRLVVALKDQCWELRTKACDALGRIGEQAGTDEVINRLVIALKDENPVVRCSACDAVGKIGKKAGTSAVLDQLTLALADHDWEVRRSACDAVGSIGEKAGASAVIDRLVVALGDNKSVVRLSACKAVSCVGEKAGTIAVIDQLVVSFGDENSKVRRSAYEVIDRIIEKTGTDAVIDRLVSAFGDQNWRIRRSACDAVVNIGEMAGADAVIDRLVIALGDEKPVVRRSACDAVGSIGEKAGTDAVIDRLLTALGDGKPDVRKSACEAIGRIGEKAGTSAVLDQLTLTLADHDWEVRRSACDAVGSIGEKAGTDAVIDRLLTALGDGKPDVRKSACEAVGRIGEMAGADAVIDRLVIALGDEKPVVRRSACDAVGSIGEKAGTDAVIDRLLTALGDGNSDVRKSACEAIGRIGEKVGTSVVIDGLVVALGDEDSEVRWSACQAVGRIGEKAETDAVIDRLLIVLGDQDLEVRWSACLAVSKIGEKAGTTPVIHALLIIMQDEELWRRKWYEKVLGSLLGLGDVKSGGNLVVALLKRSWSRSEVCPFRTIWLASMTLGYGITLNGNVIHIYGDEEPEVIERVAANQIDELTKQFAEQKEEYLGTGISLSANP